MARQRQEPNAMFTAFWSKATTPTLLQLEWALLTSHKKDPAWVIKPNSHSALAERETWHEKPKRSSGNILLFIKTVSAWLDSLNYVFGHKSFSNFSLNFPKLQSNGGRGTCLHSTFSSLRSFWRMTTSFAPVVLLHFCWIFVECIRGGVSYFKLGKKVPCVSLERSHSVFWHIGYMERKRNESLGIRSVWSRQETRLNLTGWLKKVAAQETRWVRWAPSTERPN